MNLDADEQCQSRRAIKKRGGIRAENGRVMDTAGSTLLTLVGIYSPLLVLSSARLLEVFGITKAHAKTI